MLKEKSCVRSIWKSDFHLPQQLALPGVSGCGKSSTGCGHVQGQQAGSRSSGDNMWSPAFWCQSQAFCVVETRLLCQGASLPSWALFASPRRGQRSLSLAGTRCFCVRRATGSNARLKVMAEPVPPRCLAPRQPANKNCLRAPIPPVQQPVPLPLHWRFFHYMKICWQNFKKPSISGRFFFKLLYQL